MMRSIGRFGRKFIATIVFWVTVCASAVVTGLLIFINPDCWNHDGIAWCIETYMALTIYTVMTKLNIWHVRVGGYRLRSTERPYVLAANHQSIIDTLFMALIPVPKTYTYNKKWMWVPIFGWLCWFADFVAIDKKNSKTKSQVVPNVVKYVQQGYSVMIYPEGTRNKDRVVHRLMDKLYTGAFRVAQDATCLVLPVAIQGTNHACRRGVCDFATIDITYCDPFYVAKSSEGIQAAAERFRETIDSKLGMV